MTVVLAMMQLRASNSQANSVVLFQCKKIAKDCLPEKEVQLLTVHFTSDTEPWLHPPPGDPTTVNQVHSTTNDYRWHLFRQISIPHAASDPLQFSAATPLGDQDFPKLTDMIRLGQQQ
jgi:hypothetical protein